MTMPVTFEAPRALGTSLSVSTSSAQTAALSGADLIYWCAVATTILFGADPTATGAGLYVPANTPVRLTNIKPGEKLAALAGSSSTAYYLEA